MSLVFWSKLGALCYLTAHKISPNLASSISPSNLIPNTPLLALGRSIPWSDLEDAFASLYSDKGRAAKPIRLMCVY